MKAFGYVTHHKEVGGCVAPVYALAAHVPWAPEPGRCGKVDELVAISDV